MRSAVCLLLLVALASGQLTPTMRPVPGSSMPKRPFFDGGIANLEEHCSLHTEGAVIDGVGLRLGCMLEMHDLYNPTEDRCEQFGGWASVQQSTAALYALHSMTSIFPHRGLRAVLDMYEAALSAVGADMYDSCGSSLLGITEAQALASESPLFRSSTVSTVATVLNTIDTRDCVDQLNVSMHSDPPVYGLVGPMSTGAVTAVSPLLSTYNIPHVSYWASSTLFDNLQDYPYLFRTVPSDASQVAAIADLVEHFGWDYISLVAAEDDEYSGRGFELFRSEATNRQTFCLDVTLRFSERMTSLNQTRVVARRLAHSRAKAIVVISPASSVRRFFQACQLENVTGKIFIGSHDWVNRIRFSRGDYASSVPIIGLAPRSQLSLVQQTLAGFRRALRNATYVAAAVQKDPWFRTFVEGRLECRVVLEDSSAVCESLASRPRPPPPPSSSTRAPGGRRACTAADFQRFRAPASLVIAESFFASVITLGFAIVNSVFGTDPLKSTIPDIDELPTGQDVLQQLVNLKLDCIMSNGTTMPCTVFSNGQRTVPAYYIQNVQETSPGVINVLSIGQWDPQRGVSWDRRAQLDLKEHGVFQMNNETASAINDFPTSNCSVVCAPGQYRLFPSNPLRCCWVCQNCTGNSMSNSSNADTCVTCDLGFQSNSTSCLAIAPNQFRATSVEYLVTLIIAIVGFILTLSTLVYYHLHRDAVLVRASDISLSTVSLTGMLLGYIAMPFINTVGPITDMTCLVSGVLPEPIKTLIISAVLVKTKRFNSVFNSMRILSRDKRRRFLLGTPMQLLTIALLTAINVVLSLLYGLLSPPRATSVPGFASVELFCDINYGFVGAMSGYNCVLLLVCIVLAFLTRKLPEEYNEAQLVYLASLTGFAEWVGLVPAYFITGRVLRPVISSVSLGGLCLAFWGCLFLPRLVQMFTKKAYRRPREKSIAMTDIGHGLTSGSTQRSPAPSPNMYADSRRRVYTTHSPMPTASREDLSRDSSVEDFRSDSPAQQAFLPIPSNDMQPLGRRSKFPLERSRTSDALPLSTVQPPGMGHFPLAENGGSVKRARSVSPQLPGSYTVSDV